MRVLDIGFPRQAYLCLSFYFGGAGLGACVYEVCPRYDEPVKISLVPMPSSEVVVFHALVDC